MLKQYAMVAAGVGLLCALLLPTTVGVLCLVFSTCACGFLFSAYLCNEVLAQDDGSKEMREVSDPIREGAEGFLKVQYTAVSKLAAPLAVIIFFSYLFRPTSALSEHVSNFSSGLVAAISFLAGCVCSAASGYSAMWVASLTNIRVASAARRSYGEALIVCFRGGAFSAVLNIALCVAGVSALFTMLWLFYVGAGGLSITDVPMLMVGYGFGASFVALFMQLGGGIYTKAADVGADLVGKVERSIPEDDPRNPAVIADLVGDMVGDCVGSSADVFESVAAEIIGAMILGSTLAVEAGLPPGEASKFILFPLVVHGMDILVSSAGIMYVSTLQAESNPVVTLQKGYRLAVGLSIAGFLIITRWLLATSDNPGAWFKWFSCGLTGMACAYGIVQSTQYYTDYEYSPVQSIAEASTTGHGTNIIVGVAVGMKSTMIPTVIISISVLTAFHLGQSTGLGEGHNAGLFGTAVATMGMLSTACFILSMNNYGPIADNAGGIAEMSMQPEHVRDATDRLDAAGNVTKAVTKGYSIGSAAMACFLLFGAFMDEFSAFSGRPFTSVNIATPEVLIAGLIGTMIIFYFTGLAVAAVGKTAHQVVLEVRRQFKENPDIMTYKSKPDYRTCVALVTEASLREMRFPGLVCVGTPIIVGLVFRFIGDMTDRPLLGAECLASYLMFGTVTGILMATFLDITGGAWDNAKKYIELGNFGGKNSEAHKASVTGDTVGDPFKDTAGPSLHVVIKLLSTTILVLGPLFISQKA
jgi:inorganic pyrophosphatase